MDLQYGQGSVAGIMSGTGAAWQNRIDMGRTSNYYSGTGTTVLNAPAGAQTYSATNLMSSAQNR